MNHVPEEVLLRFVEGVEMEEALQIIDELNGQEIQADTLKGYVRARVRVPVNEETAWAKTASEHQKVKHTQLNCITHSMRSSSIYNPDTQ